MNTVYMSNILSTFVERMLVKCWNRLKFHFFIGFERREEQLYFDQ